MTVLGPKQTVALKLPVLQAAVVAIHGKRRRMQQGTATAIASGNRSTAKQTA